MKGAKRSVLFLSILANWTGTLLTWELFLHVLPAITTSGSIISLGIAVLCLLITMFVLYSRLYLAKVSWVRVWMIAGPWCLSGLLCFPFPSLLLLVPGLLFVWILLGFWGAVRFYPLLGIDTRLHKARFAQLDELSLLLHTELSADGFLLGTKSAKQFVCVRPQKQRRELGNLLIVGPTRGGKSLREKSQLLSWEYSAVVNDIKGELFATTAGYRASRGPVYVFDPTGVGHRYDPLQGKTTEDQLFSAAHRLLHEPREKDPVFTDRAINMLTQIFLAARAENIAPLPYARQIMKLGLQQAVERLAYVNPALATEFLDDTYERADFTDRFLKSCWGTLKARMKPLLTETMVRCFNGSDIVPAELLCAEKPVTVYLRWPEEDVHVLTPLVRLIWGSIISELIHTYDSREGKGCKPVLLAIDEATRAPIPSLVHHATTVVGRNIFLSINIQSLGQLRLEYGEAGAEILLDNMDTQVYYRPTNIKTAGYLAEALGRQSAYAHSQTLRDGQETSEGFSEQGVPLMTPQQIREMREEEIICFHRGLPPFVINRMDWRKHPLLLQRHGMPAPQLHLLPQIADIPLFPAGALSEYEAFETIDPDLMN